MQKNMIKRKRRPWLGAMLNFFILGGGYIYNGGRRKFFGWLLFCVLILTIMDTLIFDQIRTYIPEPSPLTWIAIALVSIAFAYDAYQDAKEINRNLQV